MSTRDLSSAAEPEPVEKRDAPADRLDSWKEIAAYVKRGVRTVQRWERDSGLPVHRLNRHKRSVVFAFRSEIDDWWVAQSSDEANEDSPSAADSWGGAEFLQKKPGAHRWFIASPVLLWILALLLGLSAWIFRSMGLVPRVPEASAWEIALPPGFANPKSQF